MHEGIFRGSMLIATCETKGKYNYVTYTYRKKAQQALTTLRRRSLDFAAQFFFRRPPQGHSRFFCSVRM